ADRIAAVLGLDLLEAPGGIADRLVPAHRTPGLVDAVANHRRLDAVTVGGIAPGEAGVAAGMAVVGVAVLVRHHAHHFVALDLGLERAANAAIGAGGGHAAFGLAHLAQRLLGQGGGRAGIHAGATGNALGIDEAFVLA